ncbi:MAG TPA: GIY-YIG nuclease family protein [Terracidiphilus sp.]
MRDHNYFTYIVTSKSRTIYIGMTNSLLKRIAQHKNKTFPGFTSTNNCDRLVWFERFEHVDKAIAREKQLKGWLRSRKITLIENTNPTWEDLSAS